VPGIVVPHVIDQFYWGQRVHELGAGPEYISRGRLSVLCLSKAIQEALQDGRMRSRASELGDCIRSEPDGVEAAVGHIVQFLS
jgi:UDP:flavonoid glycosyltransferase YjiC (YdhE family)